MMKKSALTAILVAVVLSACSTENEAAKDPMLGIEEEQMIIAPEGGSYFFTFILENPADPSAVTVRCDAEWISLSEIPSSECMVSFDAVANESGQVRSSDIILVYSDGSGIELTDSLHIVQDAITSPDRYFQASNIMGAYRKDSRHYYSIFLSVDGLESGHFVPDATYYQFDFHAESEPEDYSMIQVPEGEYSISDMEVAQWFVVNSTASGYAEQKMFSDVRLVLSRDGDDMVCVVEATDEDGIVHKVDYTGQYELDLYSADGIHLVNYDTETYDPFLTYANYMGDSDGVMRISAAISGTPENGDYSKPFSMVYLDIYAPFDKYGVVAGTYTVAETSESFTLAKGEYSAELGKAVGTYIYDFREDGTSAFGFAEGGTVDIDKDEQTGIYTVTCNLHTAEGFSIRCVYEGEFDVPDIPGGAFSTLTEDYTVDLHDASPFCCFYGDKFGNGTGYYSMSLCGEFVKDDPNSYVKSGEGEEVYFEFVSDNPEYSEGIPSGTYVAGSKTPDAFQFIPGYKNEDVGALFGTYYVGAYKDGYISRCAPAISGELDVQNHGDGTYTFSFSFEDDRGNLWNGEWTGQMMVFNFSAASSQNRIPQQNISRIR